jgi:hypothetical protein
MSYTGRIPSTSSDMFRAPLVMGSTMQQGCALDLMGFINSDWDGDSVDHKSTSRYMLSLGSVPSVGREKINQQFLYHQQRLSTEEWSTSLFRHFGFKTSSLSLASSSIIRMSFGVTIKSTLNFYRDPVQTVDRTHRDPYALHQRDGT